MTRKQAGEHTAADAAALGFRAAHPHGPTYDWPGRDNGGGRPGDPPASQHLNMQQLGAGVTDPLTASRYTAAQRWNPTQLVSHVWQPFEIDRPTVLRATGRIPHLYTTAPTGVPVWQGGGCLFASPVQMGPSDFSQIGGGVYPDLQHCQKAFGPGVLYLPNPGRWWVLYVGGDSSYKCDVQQFDASDPALLSRWLNEPGAMASYNKSVGTVGVTPAEVLPRNPYRTACHVYIAGYSSGRVQFYWEDASIGGAFYISDLGSAFFSGPIVQKKALYAKCDSTTNGVVYATDFV